MRYTVTTFSFFSILLLSCAGNQKPDNDKLKTAVTEQPVAYVSEVVSASELIDTAYVRTGFYFLLNVGDKGVRMRKEHSDEIYTLQTKPFVSVDNVIDARIEKSNLNNEVYTELHLTMDEKGTNDLKVGTSKPSPYAIAIVVANRLMYVVEVKSPITDRNVVVLLEDYTEAETKKILDAVKQKR